MNDSNLFNKDDLDLLKLATQGLAVIPLKLDMRPVSRVVQNVQLLLASLTAMVDEFSKLDTDSIDEMLNEMHFPPNWKYYAETVFCDLVELSNKLEKRTFPPEE